jgi:L-iditol 2-dehydrogenase
MNRVLTCKSANTVSMDSVPMPVIGPDEILVQLIACGICGTDVAKVYDPYFVKPQKIGHELVATITQSHTSQFTIGQRVAVAHHAPDPESHFTKRGSAPMDPVFKSSNIDPGGFSDFIRVPATLVPFTVVPVPDHVPDLRAIFMEPLACCLRAMDRISIEEGDTALIVGAGAVGILFVPLLRDANVKSLVTDVRQERIDLALKWGAMAGRTVADGDIAEVAMQHSEGRGADLIILCVFTRETVKTAMNAVRDGGTILIFGSKPNNEIVIDWWDIWRREINLITSYSATPDLMPRAMALLASEGYALESLVSHQFPLAEAQTGFDLARQGRVGKVVVTEHK